MPCQTKKHHGCLFAFFAARYLHSPWCMRWSLIVWFVLCVFFYSFFVRSLFISRILYDSIYLVYVWDCLCFFECGSNSSLSTEQPNNQHSFMEVTVFSCYVLFFFWIELFLSVFIHFVSFRLCVVFFFFLFFQYFAVLRTKGILWKLASENNKHGREKTRSCRRWMVESLVMMSVMTEKASYRRIKTKNQGICSSFFRPIHRFFLPVVNVVVIIIIIANFFSLSSFWSRIASSKMTAIIYIYIKRRIRISNRQCKLRELRTYSLIESGIWQKVFTI